MTFVSVFILMLFLHVVADFNLQGILASMKQREWWVKQVPKNRNLDNTIYKNDYKISLLIHAFEWSFVVMLPLFHASLENLFEPQVFVPYFGLLIYNTVIHYYIDDLKANRKTIPLVVDQLGHMAQILLTVFMWSVFVGF